MTLAALLRQVNAAFNLMFIFTWSWLLWRRTFITRERCEDTTENSMISGIERPADLNHGKVELRVNCSWKFVYMWHKTQVNVSRLVQVTELYTRVYIQILLFNILFNSGAKCTQQQCPRFFNCRKVYFVYLEIYLCNGKKHWSGHKNHSLIHSTAEWVFNTTATVMAVRSDLA